MNDELEEELVNKYPDIFYYRTRELDNDKLNPPIVLGIECNDGWYYILDTLCSVIKDSDAEVHVTQIKEKFGGLRFYHEGIKSNSEQETYKILGAINHAEEMCLNTCEICGKPGEFRNDGWMKVRCDDCYSE